MSDRRSYVESFLECMAPGETASHCFQVIHDRDKAAAAAILHGSFEQHHAELEAYSARGYGIFWTVNRTNGCGRAKTDITAVRAVWLDIDEPGRDIAPIEAAMPPHAVVESSPGKLHVYWRVADCTLEEFNPLLDALTERWQGDKGAKGINRVMRLPGFPHQKAEPFVTRVLRWLP